MNNPKIVSLLLRIGIAITFIYAAIATMLHPDDWIWFFPTVLRDTIPHPILLTGFSIFEIVLSLWLLSGWKAVYSGTIAAIATLGIIFANLSTIDIVFRDVAIFFAAVALAIGSYKKSSYTASKKK